jgi:hypothetical protein
MVVPLMVDNWNQVTARENSTLAHMVYQFLSPIFDLVICVKQVNMLFDYPFRILVSIQSVTYALSDLEEACVPQK